VEHPAVHTNHASVYLRQMYGSNAFYQSFWKLENA
jgi:hypothetical protein